MERDRNQRRAGHVSVGLIVVLSLLFGALGYLLIERRARVEAGRRERQAHFADSHRGRGRGLQRGQAPTREHRSPKLGALVLNRNNSADRLEPTTPVPEDSPVREALRNAEPESCLAIRMGRMHHPRPESRDAPVLRTLWSGRELDMRPLACGRGGDRLIGYVLLEHPGPLGERQRSM